MEERAAKGGLVAPGLQAAGSRRRCRSRLVYECPGTSGSPATELLSRLEVRRTGTLLFNDVFTELKHTYLAILRHKNLAYFYDMSWLRVAGSQKKISTLITETTPLVRPFRRPRALSAAGRAGLAGRSTTAGRRWKTGCGGRKWQSRGSTRPPPSPRTSTR